MFALALWDRRTPAAGAGARPASARSRSTTRRRRGPARAVSVRLRDQGGAGLAGDARASPNLARDRRLPDAAIRAVARDGLRRHEPAAAGALPVVDARWPPVVGAMPEPVRYWELPEPRTGGSLPQAGGAARGAAGAVCDEAVRLRMIADVPLGAFLSGGVDSSAVVAMMARAGTGRVKTFSIGFSGQANTTRPAMPAWSPSATAPSTRSSSSSPMRSRYCRSLVWHYGEPFADPSAMPTYYVSQLARRHVTVALNGDGGDEAFLGYARYQAMRHLDAARPAAGSGAPRPGAAAATLAPAGWQRRLRLRQIGEMLTRRDRPAGAALRRRDRVLRRRATRRPAMARRCSTELRAFGARPAGALFRRRREPGRPAPTGPTSTPICRTTCW